MRKVRAGCRTLRLLYEMDRSAFLISASTSVIQALVYPLILVIVWQAFRSCWQGQHRAKTSYRKES
jgi:hypothetical protein